MNWTSRRGSRHILTAAFLAFCLSSAAEAITFVVTKTADTADGACNADCSLREAIIAANALAGPDIITLPAGNYVLTIPGDTGEDASLTGDLDIGAGGLTINGAGAATTFVDGNNAIRVFEVVGAGAVTFFGLTVRNGLGGFGGGIENDSTATVTIDQSAILNNQGNFGGGINNNSSGTIIITNSTVSGNTATGFGGGINNNSGGTVTLDEVIVSNNTAQGFGGGGINNNFNGTMTITESSITGNTAQNGGGINNNSGGSMTITDTTVSGNTATDDSPGGGGILNNSSGPMTIIESTISGNTSDGPGGGINNNSSGTLTITNSTISGNSSTDPKTGEGGGVYRGSSGPVTLTNVTVIGNSAPPGQGGGIFNNRLDSPITLLRSIVANSVGGNCGGVILSLGNNLSSDATCNLVAAGDLPNTNPLVAPLASNGGPTQTHALLAGSPAINAGGAGCPPPGTDQRGVTRPQGAACEIGSFECQAGECTALGATPTPTPVGPAPTATRTPTAVPPTAVPTAPGGPPPANVPMLSWPLLALLGIGIAGTGYLLARRG